MSFVVQIVQMKLITKQKQIHRHREQTYCCQGREVGEGWIGSLGLGDPNYHTDNG